MCAATEFGVHHVTVGGELVGAHAEHQTELAAQRNVEAAVATNPPGRARHRRPWPVVAVMPPLCRVPAAPQAKHPTPAEPDLDGHIVDDRVTGRHVPGHQAWVVGRRRQQIARTQIARPDPFLPRHPFRRQQRRRARDEHDFTDGRVLGAGARGHHDCPLPTAISGQLSEEAVRRRRRVLELGSEVLPHGALAAVFLDRRARRVDGAGQHRLQPGCDVSGPRRGHRLGAGGALSQVLVRGFGHAVHCPQSCPKDTTTSHTGCPCAPCRLHGGESTRDRSAA